MGELGGVNVFGGEAVGEQEYGSVRALGIEHIFHIHEVLEMAGVGRDYIAAALNLLVKKMLLRNTILARTMEPDNNSFCILVPEPMRLCAAGQSNGFGVNIFGLAESKICFSRVDACISLLIKVHVAELCAHHGIDNVLEVVVGAMLALEG